LAEEKIKCNNWECKEMERKKYNKEIELEILCFAEEKGHSVA